MLKPRAELIPHAHFFLPAEKFPLCIISKYIINQQQNECEIICIYKLNHHQIHFFFLAIPKTCISVLWVTRHNRVWGSKLIGITLHFYIGHLGLGCIFFFISLTFNCLVRSRLAERETWLDSSRWGLPCSCE